MEESASGTSRVYWDATGRTSVSASVYTDPEVSLETLIEWWDRRGFTGLERPEVPPEPLTEQFESGALYDLAAPFLDASGAACEPGTVDANEVESVFCSWDNGVTAEFTSVADAETLRTTRAAYDSEEGTVGGTYSTSTWNYTGGEVEGTKVEYIDAESVMAALYFDQDSTNCYVIMNAADDDQDALEQFWMAGE